MGYIYKITNLINNKIYIGKTNYSIETRWNQHICAAYSQNNINYNNILHKAIRKYGKENFQIEKIDEIDNDKELSILEQYYIQKYNSCILQENNNGYNMTYGGEGNCIVNKEDIFYLWDEGKGSIEIHNILNYHTDTIKKYLETYQNYNKEIDISRNKGGKIVYQFDYNGNLIQEFPSILSAAKELEVDRNVILRCCKKEKNSCKGYYWSFNKNDKFDVKQLYQQKKYVIIQKENNKIINTYNSFVAAGKAVNIKNTKLIKECCEGKRKSAYGFNWEYKVDALARKGAAEVKEVE